MTTGHQASRGSFTGILPLTLAEQAKTAVEEVLRASYRPSTPAFSNLIDDFVRSRTTSSGDPT